MALDDKLSRCFWCGDDQQYIHYHDSEWGYPVDDDRRLFEKVCLEGFQSGLSWLTILRKRENFRAAFDNFEIEKVARYDERDVDRLLADVASCATRARLLQPSIMLNGRLNCAKSLAHLPPIFGNSSQR